MAAQSKLENVLAIPASIEWKIETNDSADQVLFFPPGNWCDMSEGRVLYLLPIASGYVM